MNALQFLGKVYSLDTLDTRFTTSSRSPPSATNAVRSTGKESRNERGSRKTEGASPSKWRTLEFFYHYAVFLIAVPGMFYTVYNVSQRMYCLDISRSGHLGLNLNSMEP